MSSSARDLSSFDLSSARHISIADDVCGWLGQKPPGFGPGGFLSGIQSSGVEDTRFRNMGLKLGRLRQFEVEIWTFSTSIYTCPGQRRTHRVSRVVHRIPWVQASLGPRLLCSICSEVGIKFLCFPVLCEISSNFYVFLFYLKFHSLVTQRWLLRKSSKMFFPLIWNFIHRSIQCGLLIFMFSLRITVDAANLWCSWNAV